MDQNGQDNEEDVFTEFISHQDSNKESEHKELPSKDSQSKETERKDSTEQSKDDDDDTFFMDKDNTDNKDKPSGLQGEDSMDAAQSESSASGEEKGIFRRTLGSVGNLASSLGSSFPGSPNVSSILNYPSSLFHLSEDKDKEKEETTEEEKENHFKSHCEVRLVDRPELFKTLDGKIKVFCSFL